MNKEIRYNGFTTEPSDYESPDGELAVAINVIPDNGHLAPVLPPSVAIDAAENSIDAMCVYIHKTSAFEHFINRSGNSFSWYDRKYPKTRHPLGAVTDFISLSSVGNTLVFLTEAGLQYFLWKDESTGYIHLGSHIPECPISFGLQGEVIRTDSFNITFDPIAEDNLYDEFSDENKTRISDQVLAKVNKFIAEKSVHDGRFIFPFLVRYAYRMYDGSLTMHSAPVLMITSSTLAPWTVWTRIGHEDKKYTNADIAVMGVVHKLDFAVADSAALKQLRNWSDIIRSIDIFISRPIYTYDQNGQCSRFYNGFSEYEGYSVCRHINQKSSQSEYPLRYQRRNLTELWWHTFGTVPGGVLMLPRRSDDDVKADIKNCAQFYLLESVNIENLSTDRSPVPVENDYLQSLVAREVMTDDYDSHDALIPRCSFPYNSRLNLADMSKTIFQGFNPSAAFCFTDGYVGRFSDTDNHLVADGKAALQVYVYIKKDGRDIILRSPVGSMASYADTPLLFFYYPDVSAYKAVIVRSAVFDMAPLVINLEPHNFLNGAFYFAGWQNPEAVSAPRPLPSSLAERTVSIPNKLYTSEVNNPFFFPLSGINTVGTGRISAICSAAKALSQGQFGQFPLYAFTDEGVWAMEISATGSYSARQPITRDCCINPDGITQLDSAVLFPTARGIMLISGSQTQCISDSINSGFPFDARSLPGFQLLHDMLGHNPDTDICLPTQPLSDFLRQCRMTYDYTNQRIIVYAPRISYAYVYSLRSKQWGMMHSQAYSNLNSYPDALAVDAAGNIIDFSNPGTDTVSALFVTRPLKLDAPDILKTVSSVIQRGFFPRDAISTALYGSRDLFNWHLIRSGRGNQLRGYSGTPYKYFRIAVLANLKARHSIYGATVEFRHRHTNRLR